MPHSRFLGWQLPRSRHAATSALAAAMHRALTSSNACLLALICGSIELERRMQAKLEKQEVRYDARCAAPAADAPGQFRVLQLPFAGGPKALAVYEDASAGPGGRVWDASVALSRYLAANVDASSEVCARSVVEVGAGAGAPGMTAALMGGVVTLTKTSGTFSLTCALHGGIEAAGLSSVDARGVPPEMPHSSIRLT